MMATPKNDRLGRPQVGPLLIAIALFLLAIASAYLFVLVVLGPYRPPPETIASASAQRDSASYSSTRTWR